MFAQATFRASDREKPLRLTNCHARLNTLLRMLFLSVLILIVFSGFLVMVLASPLRGAGGAVVSRSALSTIGLRLQAILLVTCRGLRASLR